MTMGSFIPSVVRSGYAHVRLLGLTAAVGVGVALAASSVSAQQTPDTPALAPLSFTESQASQGASIFSNSCSGCHGAELGGLDAPALTGDVFSHWFDGSVGQLFDYMKMSMPLDDPGSLSDSRYVQLIAFIASRNGFTAGDVALPQDDTEALAGIGFTQP